MRIANWKNRNMARKLKPWKMRHKHSMTWNMARNTEKREKWKYLLQDLENGNKTHQLGK